MSLYKSVKRGVRTFVRGSDEARKYGRKFTHHRYGTWTKPKMANVYKDVAMLKALVNVEKKRALVSAANIKVARYDTAGINTGAQILDITPVITQGDAGNQRNGNSLKLQSLFMDLWVEQQSATVNNLSLNVKVICVPEDSSTSGDPLTQFYQPNLFTNVIDSGSNRDPEYFTRFKVIKNLTVNIKEDNLAGGNYNRQLKVPLKLGTHLKYNTDASTTSTKNRYFMICTCDQGANVSNSGVSINYGITYFYTDN